MARALAELTDVSKRLGKTQALAGVSAEFKPGMIHGIIGPNAAGKTTLLRVLAGLLRPDTGAARYFLDGAPAPMDEMRKKLAYFPQEPSLYPDLSCQEHLEFFADLYQLDKTDFKTRSAELLAMAGLGGFRARRAGQLSGGMYKKLGLACVLLSRPAALLLDEPTIGVDPVSRRELWALMSGLAAGGLLIIMSTSYMDEAARCGAVQLIDAGKIIASGAPEAVLENAGAANFEEVFLKYERAPAL